jgi:hypothetical protein
VHARDAVWLQTELGFDWRCDEPEARDAYPVDHEEIIEHITTRHIYAEAGRWSNARIRSYIDRSSTSD